MTMPDKSTFQGVHHRANAATLAIMLLTGLSIGWVLSRAFQPDSPSGQPGTTTTGDAYPRSRKMTRPQAESPAYGRVVSLRSDLKKAPKEQLPGIVYRILELGDPVDRQALLVEAFAGADADTCQAIMDQFGAITRDTGRLQHGDWRTGLFLAGKAGGAELLNRWVGVHSADGTEFQEAIRGFATSDPQGALAWLNAQEESKFPHKQQLLSRVLAGAAVGDPETAVRMMNQLAPQQQASCLEEFTTNLIQSSGLQRTTEWMLEVLQTPEPESLPMRNAMIEAQMFRRVFEASEWYDHEQQMAQRIAEIHQKRPVPQHQLLGMIRKMHGASALNLTEKLATTPLLRDPEISAQAVSTALSSISPAQAKSWLDGHPNSPIRQAVEESLNRAGN